MNLFQYVLLALILLLLVVVNRTKTRTYERILTVFVVLVGIVFVIFPNLPTYIANLFGIGRGADFIFYLFIIFSIFWFTSISARVRNTDKKLTEIVRTIALSSPQLGPRDQNGDE